MGTGVDLRSTTKTRVQRRAEKKQTVLLVLLVLVISVVSFGLGVIVGRSSIGSQRVQRIPKSQRLSVTGSPTTSGPKKTAAASPDAEKLTFYDTLSKEEPAPIGSGINLPPKSENPATGKQISDQLQEKTAALKKESAPVAAAIATPGVQSTSVAPTPNKPGSHSTSARKELSAPDRMPQVTKGGAWAVQLFSSKSAADAGKLRDKLNKKGYPAFISEAELGAKGIWYRVLLGPYADKQTAVQAQVFVEKRDKLKGFTKRR